MSKKDQKDTIGNSARYLANLLSTEVAGFLPDDASDGHPPKLDLDVELRRRNVAIASLVILAALVKDEHSDRIIHEVKPDYFALFPRYLFELITDRLSEGRELDFSEIKSRIPDYSRKYYHEEPNERTLKGDYFTWEQVLSLNPTSSQIEEAIKLRRLWAEETGLH